MHGASHLLHCLYGRNGDMNDPIKAFSWLKVHAAEGGGRVTHQNLGFAYERGTGTGVDKSRAYTWFYLTARQNPADPPSEWEYLDRVAKFLTPEEVTEAKERAEAWIHRDGGTAEDFDHSDGRPSGK